MNEAEAGSAGAPDDGGRHQGSPGDSSPFQARAPFLENWDWKSVVRINVGACERGQAQHGVGSETGKACEESWQLDCAQEQTLVEALHLLRSYHRRAPFLFFNGNTFAAIARQIAEAVFHELPTIRRRPLRRRRPRPGIHGVHRGFALRVGLVPPGRPGSDAARIDLGRGRARSR